VAILVGSLLAVCLLGAWTTAQQPQTQGGAAPGGSRFPAEIALVDIQFIFKNYPRVKQYETDLQADMEKAEAALKNEVDAIKKLQERLNDFRPGSAEYEDLEGQIVKRQAEFNARRTLQRKDFLKVAAKIHGQIYQQIQEEVDAFASAYGVRAVLVFNREAMDPEKPETIQAALNNPVLWHHRDLDITKYILDNLNRHAGPAQTGSLNPGFPKSNPPDYQRR
jgi:Skp family chaperone for outer membrane proteins